ncbi:MAG: Beta-galactosidase [Lentisphaerae bacterium ADurb.Bin242]|nr:MAG: Beta-galactosidase [Lentisphaerae bacterium ADurb.Bin242]
MKKSLLFAAALAVSAAVPLHAKHDGWYFNELTRKYETPHLEWGKDLPTLKALFILPPAGARDVVEMAQRMNLDYAAVVAHNHAALSTDSVYAAALTGTSAYEKGEEIRAKAQAPYDVIFIANGPFTSLPPDAQFQLLQKVKEGAGLVVISKVLPYRKLFAKPLPAPEFLKEVLLPPGVKAANIKAYQFDKGRILCLNYNAPALTPVIPTDNQWYAQYENALVFLMRCGLWAAGKDISLGKVEKQGDSVNAGDAVVYRLRDAYNRILAQGKAENGKVALPALGNGRFYCDLMIPGKTFGMIEWKESSSLGDIGLEMPSDVFFQRAPFSGTFRSEKPFPAGLKLTLELVDSPNGRIWERMDIPLPAGKTTVPFEFRKYRIPTEAGYLYARVADSGGKTVANAEKELFFPSGVLSDYYQVTFGNATTFPMAMQLVDNLGFEAALTHLNPDGARQLALRNIRMVPYLTRVTISRNAKNGVTMMMLSPRERDELKKLGDDQSFYRPEVRKLWKDQVVERMKGLPKYAPVLYSLGDENVLNLAAGYGPSDLPAFRAFLKKKYGTVDRLNKEWESQHASFDSIEHRPQEQSLKEKKFVEWNDHNEYMEQMFADVHHYSAEIIKGIDSRAKVGLEGTFGGHNIEKMMEKLDWWGPYSNPIEDEVLRSLYPDVKRFVWSGYHGERGPGVYPKMCDYLLKGSVNGNGWYGTGCDFYHDILAVDQSPSFPKSFIDELQRLRFGMAQLLIDTPLHDSGVAVWWDHLSRRSGTVDERCVSPESGIGPLLRFCYRNGVGLEFVTSRTADRLKKVRVLFLLGANVMSEADAKVILDFAKNGGTVIADLPPAALNEYMRKRESNPLAPLFGDISLLKPGKYEIRSMQLPELRASKALVNPERPLMEMKNFGKGKTLLLNFNFSIVETSADAATPLDGFLRRLLENSGIPILYSLDNKAVFRVRDGQGFELLGLHADKPGETLTLTLPEERFVYECGAGYVGHQKKISVCFDASPLRVYTAFAEKQKAPSVKVSSRVKAGGNIHFDFKNIPSGRIVVLRAFAPDGREMPERNAVFNTAKFREFLFPLPYNAVPGDYRFEVMDFTTGLSGKYTVAVE